jgi:hypothetical protein
MKAWRVQSAASKEVRGQALLLLVFGVNGRLDLGYPYQAFIPIYLIGLDQVQAYGAHSESLRHRGSWPVSAQIRVSACQ